MDENKLIDEEKFTTRALLEYALLIAFAVVATGAAIGSATTAEEGRMCWSPDDIPHCWSEEAAK
jgi:hypothetical protein